jgi:hypothetical protein
MRPRVDRTDYGAKRAPRARLPKSPPRGDWEGQRRTHLELTAIVVAAGSPRAKLAA